MEVSAILAKILGNEKILFIMRFSYGNALPIYRYLCWLNVGFLDVLAYTPAVPPPCRLDIILI
jgi:hypothetical protein